MNAVIIIIVSNLYKILIHLKSCHELLKLFLFKHKRQTVGSIYIIVINVITIYDINTNITRIKREYYMSVLC